MKYPYLFFIHSTSFAIIIKRRVLSLLRAICDPTCTQSEIVCNRV